MGEQSHLLGEIVAVSSAIRQIPHGRFQNELTRFKEWARNQVGKQPNEIDMSELSDLGLDPLFTSLATSVQKAIMGEVYSFARSTFTDRILAYVTQIYPSPGTIGSSGRTDFFDVRIGNLARSAMQKTFGGVPDSERRALKYEESWLAGFQSIVDEEHARLGLPGEAPKVTFGIEGRVPTGRAGGRAQGGRGAQGQMPQKFNAGETMDEIMQGMN
jgi:hypothetical protein